MHGQMLALVAEGMDVAEIYSPPRVAKMATQLGMRAGWSLDLATHDRDGQAWEFRKKEMRNRAMRKINKDKPLLIVGIPMCTGCGAMVDFNSQKVTAEEKARRMHEARECEILHENLQTQS